MPNEYPQYSGPLHRKRCRTYPRLQSEGTDAILPGHEADSAGAPLRGTLTGVLQRQEEG